MNKKNYKINATFCNKLLINLISVLFVKLSNIVNEFVTFLRLTICMT